MKILIESEDDLIHFRGSHPEMAFYAYENGIPVVIPDLTGKDGKRETTFEIPSDLEYLSYVFEGGAHVQMTGIYAEPEEDNEGVEHELEVVLRGSSRATIRDCRGFKIYAYDKAQISAIDSTATIQYMGGSSGTVIACENVVTYEDSCLSALNSQVASREMSRVAAHGASKVEAYDSSTVCAFDTTNVTAFDSATVSAHGSVRVDMQSPLCVTVTSAGQVSTSGEGRTIHIFEDTTTPVQGEDEGKDEGNE